MTELSLYYAMLGLAFLGAFLGMALIFSGGIGGDESLADNPVKLNFTIIAAALAFSPAIYAIVLGMLIWTEMDMGALAENPNTLYVLGAFGIGALLASVIRGVVARAKLSETHYDVNRFVMLVAGTEVLVLPGLVGAIMIIFV